MKQLIVLDHNYNRKDIVETDFTPKIFDCIVPQKTTITLKLGLNVDDNDIIIFHAGTAIKDNKLVTSGGRVLNICALGKDLNDVRNKIYKAAKIIDFEGKQYRSDIGLR